MDGQFEDRRPSLPDGAGAVGANFSEATAPGLASQPNFLHYSTTLHSDSMHIAERATNPLSASAGGIVQPLMKPRIVYRFQNNAAYHWYNDLDTGHYSFQQFVFEGDESVAFSSVLQRFVTPGTSWITTSVPRRAPRSCAGSSGGNLMISSAAARTPILTIRMWHSS